MPPRVLPTEWFPLLPFLISKAGILSLHMASLDLSTVEVVLCTVGLAFPSFWQHPPLKP